MTVTVIYIQSTNDSGSVAGILEVLWWVFWSIGNLRVKSTPSHAAPCMKIWDRRGTCLKLLFSAMQGFYLV